MSWIKKVLYVTQEAESPERFIYWSSLAAVSAVVRKNIWINRHYHILYPNLFVILVARSGLGKNMPVSLARTLVDTANCTRLVIGRNSIQQVVKDLAKAYSTAQGKIIDSAHGFLVSGELAAFLVKDPDALTILTDLYDTHSYEKEWRNSLKGSGIDTLKSPCVTLLGATNETHFSEAIPNNAVGGGFVGRTSIVVEDTRRCINSYITAPRITYDVKQLAEPLINISQLKGEVTFEQHAAIEYDKWVHEFYRVNHADPTGTLERIRDGILKTAMLLAVSEDGGDRLVMQTRHIEEATVESLKCIGGMRQVTMGQGKSSLAYATKLVMTELITRPDHMVSRAKLLAKFWGEFDAPDLDRIADTLESSGAITLYRSGKEILFKLKPNVLESYTAFAKEIQ